MKYILVEWEHELEDEPYQIYSELDGDRRETRRVEFYRSGVTFSCGAERGNEGALTVMPENPPKPEEGEQTIRGYSRGCSKRFCNRPRSGRTGLLGSFF